MVREKRGGSGSLCWSCGGAFGEGVKTACALLEVEVKPDRATARADCLCWYAVKGA